MAWTDYLPVLRGEFKELQKRMDTTNDVLKQTLTDLAGVKTDLANTNADITNLDEKIQAQDEQIKLLMEQVAAGQVDPALVAQVAASSAEIKSLSAALAARTPDTPDAA